MVQYETLRKFSKNIINHVLETSFLENYKNIGCQ